MPLSVERQTHPRISLHSAGRPPTRRLAHSKRGPGAAPFPEPRLPRPVGVAPSDSAGSVPATAWVSVMDVRAPVLVRRDAKSVTVPNSDDWPGVVNVTNVLVSRVVLVVGNSSNEVDVVRPAVADVKKQDRDCMRGDGGRTTRRQSVPWQPWLGRSAQHQQSHLSLEPHTPFDR